MLFQLPIDADTTVLDKGIYVDELKRVKQTDLEQWMFSGNTEIGALKIPNAFTHSGLTPSMLLKWIANYGLALADVDEEEYRKITDELDRRLSTMKSAHFDRLFHRDEKRSQFITSRCFCTTYAIFRFPFSGQSMEDDGVGRSYW